jgi:hypothetical protein
MKLESKVFELVSCSHLGPVVGNNTETRLPLGNLLERLAETQPCHKSRFRTTTQSMPSQHFKLKGLTC